MEKDGLFKTNSLWEKGYVSGNNVEIDYLGYMNLKGTVEGKKIIWYL